MVPMLFFHIGALNLFLGNNCLNNKSAWHSWWKIVGQNPDVFVVFEHIGLCNYAEVKWQSGL